MSFTVLTVDPKDLRTLEVQLVGRYAGQHVEIEAADPSHPESWNVGAKLPALRIPEGGFWELNSILRFLARTNDRHQIYGNNIYEASLIDTWVDWATHELESSARHVYPVSVLEGQDIEAVADAVDKIRGHFDTLNKHLINNTFIATQRITIADIAVAFSILPLFSEIFDTGFRKQFSNVVRWYETVVNQPLFISVVGTVEYASKTALPNLPKKAAKQPAKKGAAKKGAAKNDDGNDEEAPEPVLEEAGEKLDIGYLGALPPSTFNLEQWKTTYANTVPSRPEATNYFWTHFDPEGWSLYTFTYNFPEECDKQFKTANLFGGFLQRAEVVKSLAKFSMTSMVILEHGNIFHIQGVWLFRGNCIPPEFLKVDDTNYYTWTKIDPTSEEQRNFVSDIWAWDAPNGWKGGEFVGGKTWGC